MACQITRELQYNHHLLVSLLLFMNKQYSLIEKPLCHLKSEMGGLEYHQ
jgi:hypothetical protein